MNHTNLIVIESIDKVRVFNEEGSICSILSIWDLWLEISSPKRAGIWPRSIKWVSCPWVSYSKKSVYNFTRAILQCVCTHYRIGMPSWETIDARATGIASNQKVTSKSRWDIIPSSCAIFVDTWEGDQLTSSTSKNMIGFTLPSFIYELVIAVELSKSFFHENTP